MLLGGILIGVSSWDFLPKKVIWNASQSVSVGLYFVQDRDPARGDLVLVRFPDWVALIASRRDYLFPDLPAVKKVAALSGDVVCRLEETITINGMPVATAQRRDGWGRKMPLWSGCRMLKAGEVFLLNDHPQSFDGRYFGVTGMSDVIGVARPIW
ncbi:MAG: S26 family signal peptidase [Hyphomicrobiaceae bacterium]|nr:S26 family signal peptidase [Hyphomicrobiaceae bacterium]